VIPNNLFVDRCSPGGYRMIFLTGRVSRRPWASASRVAALGARSRCCLRASVWSVQTLGTPPAATFPGGRGWWPARTRIGARGRATRPAPSRPPPSVRKRTKCERRELTLALAYAGAHGGGTVGVRAEWLVAGHHRRRLCRRPRRRGEEVPRKTPKNHQGEKKTKETHSAASLSGARASRVTLASPTWSPRAPGVLRWLFSVTARRGSCRVHSLGATRVLQAAAASCTHIRPTTVGSVRIQGRGAVRLAAPASVASRGYAALISRLNLRPGSCSP